MEEVLVARIASGSSTILSKRGEDLCLGRGVLDDGLDDELPVGQVVEAAREDQPGQCVLGTQSVQLAALDGTFERDGHPLTCGAGGYGVRLADHGVQTGAGAHLGDPAPIWPAAHDPDPADG